MFASIQTFFLQIEAFGLLSSLPSYSPAEAQVTAIPRANGSYGVGSNAVNFTDYSRVDPFSPNRQQRSVVVSAFYPAAPIETCHEKVVDYMPPRTALFEDETYSQYGIPNGTFESLKLSQCDHDSQTIDKIEKYPLVMFSPGLGVSRLLYSAVAQSVASHGFVVVTVDHPYDASVVEFPDGTLVLGANITTDAEIELTLSTRVEDVSFILDQLSLVSSTRRLLPFATTSLNTQKVPIYGHSLGGATAAAVTMNDSRIAGSVDMDGTLFGPVVKRGFSAPFMIFEHEQNNTSQPSWNETWSHLPGWKLELELAGSEHGTFIDFPIIVKSLGLTKYLPPKAVALIGTIDGARALDIISAYLRAFLRFALSGATSPLLQGPVEDYPEVTIVAR